MKRLFDGHNEQVYGRRRYFRFILTYFKNGGPRSTKLQTFRFNKTGNKNSWSKFLLFLWNSTKNSFSWLFITAERNSIVLLTKHRKPWSLLINSTCFPAQDLKSNFEMCLKLICTSFWHQNDTQCPQTSFPICTRRKSINSHRSWQNQSLWPPERDQFPSDTSDVSFTPRINDFPGDLVIFSDSPEINW